MLKRTLFVIALLTSFMVNAEKPNFPTKPNPEMTYGTYCDEKNEDFEGYRYEEKIPYCVRNVTREMKRKIYELYSIPERCRHEYTIDHFIPLAMGGSNHPENLWPEHKHVKATRQNLEMDIYIEISHGRIKQREAIEVITQAKMNPPRDIPAGCQ